MKQFFLGLIFLIPFNVNADLWGLDSMVMPGELIEGHKKFEDNCTNCHVRFNKKAQDDTCLACHLHKNIAEDIRTGTGYHGRIKIASCKSCHTDHKGRSKKIVELNRKQFDHNNTDYSLKDLHKKVSCSKCHDKEKKYSEAPQQCHACHKKDDAHKGNLGNKCQECHSEAGWKKTEFDHDKTHFRLEGAHQKVKCHSCHKDNNFRATPHDCNSCHRQDDVHKGRLGQQCNDCHNDRSWKKTKFDHGKTAFPLSGAHMKVECKSCHKNRQFKDTAKDCYSCHQKDDAHKGGLGTDCRSCHVDSDWNKVKFDHGDTGYPLQGRHKLVECKSCHIQHKYKDTSRECYACHRKDDIHKEQLGRNCASCHTESDWKQALFEHDVLKFPLLGKHAKLECKECHKSGRYRDAPDDCYSCHKKKDVHKLKFGTECQQCHNPASWNNWKFDHTRQTGFKLDGGHSNLECHACHKEQTTGKMQLSALCVSCHERDDAHDGGFGNQCERCHITEKFAYIRSHGRILK